MVYLFLENISQFIGLYIQFYYWKFILQLIHKKKLPIISFNKIVTLNFTLNLPHKVTVYTT